MWSKVERYIEKHKLLNPNELYLVALSGGADSVALLLLLKNAHFNVHAAHCNFHLRGDESDRDEAFCVELCQRLGVELHRAHFDTREYAELHKVSIEMAARELRYKWFEQLRQDIGAAGICVAHHRDDSVETVLLNLVSGTGLRGLTGIQPRNGHILRPLLCVSRAEIEAFLAEKGQKYVTDSTNLEADVQRNIVRLEVLPLLRKLNPAVAENIQRTAENLAEAQLVLNVAIASINSSNILNLSDLEKYGSSEYLAFEWLKKYGFSVRKKPVYVSKEPYVATLDAAKVRFPLTVRRVEEGDWMQPYGMKGRKLLSDLMTDLKMTVFEKRRQLVVVDSQGVIVWAIGLRIADFVAVSDVTKTVIELVLAFCPCICHFATLMSSIVTLC